MFKSHTIIHLILFLQYAYCVFNIFIKNPEALDNIQVSKIFFFYGFEINILCSPRQNVFDQNTVICKYYSNLK